MADMMYNRASGRTPSIASAMADRQMQQAAAEQSSAAASARGPAALALAQQGAAANTASMQSNISNQAQINAAQERMQAEQNAYNAYSGVSAQDAARAQAQAQFDDAQRARNDAMTMGMTGNEIGVNTAQLAAKGNQAALKQGGAMTLLNEEAARQQADDAKTAQVAGAVATGVATVAGGMMGGPAGAAAGNAVGQAATSTTKQPPSDERAKDISTWGDMPEEPAAAPTSTWGTGTGEDQFTMSKRIARNALDDQEAQEQFDRGGPTATAGVQALKDADAEELGLIRAKERNGVPLTRSEENHRAALEHRERAAKRDEAAAKGVAAAPPAPAPNRSLAKALLGVAPSVIGSITTNRFATPQNVYRPQLQPIPGAPGIRSDMTSKVPYGDDITSDEEAKNVVPLRRETGDVEQHYDRDVSRAAPDVTSSASLSGPMPRYSMAQAVERRSNPEPAQAKRRKLSDAELIRMAKEMQAQTAAQGETLRGGPSVGRASDPMAASNRSMEASPYTYKPEFAAEAGQLPGEQNVGPMAQKMARDPVARTAVERDPNTGLLSLDRDKFAKVTAGGVASLQRQVDRQNQVISFMAQRLGLR
jgi:hypothetical protein